LVEGERESCFLSFQNHVENAFAAAAAKWKALVDCYSLTGRAEGIGRKEGRQEEDVLIVEESRKEYWAHARARRERESERERERETGQSERRGRRRP
jgi:hypothetical protein